MKITRLMAFALIASALSFTACKSKKVTTSAYKTIGTDIESKTIGDAKVKTVTMVEKLNYVAVAVPKGNAQDNSSVKGLAFTYAQNLQSEVPVQEKAGVQYNTYCIDVRKIPVAQRLVFWEDMTKMLSFSKGNMVAPCSTCK